MISFRSIFFIVGLFSIVLSGMMLLPVLIEMREGSHTWGSFGLSALIGFFVGMLLVLSTKPKEPIQFKIQEIFLLTSISWFFLSLLGSLPLYMSPTLNMTFVDALFESTSGLTTTGGTVMIGLDHAPRGILLWRALLQGLGGIGIIVMALTILPFLSIGGMQLFHSEFSDRSEKILPRASQIASAIFSIYFLLTLLCALLLGLAGMPIFDALCHALSTISTGGFSTHDASIGHYKDNIMVQVILMLFMIIGGSTLILFVRFGRGESRILWQDAQMRVYLSVLVCVSLALGFWLVFINGASFQEGFLDAAFHAVSIITTTGFVETNYDTWGGFPSVIFFFLMFVGGCTGSTTGGIKIFRFQVLFLIARMHLKLLRRPHGVFIPTYNKRPISESVIVSVLTFFALYGFSFAVIAGLLGITGVDLTTALSGAASGIGNIGPALGKIIGPVGTFAPLSDSAKYVLIFAMLLGRLELLTVLVLFTPSFWKE